MYNALGEAVVAIRRVADTVSARIEGIVTVLMLVWTIVWGVAFVFVAYEAFQAYRYQKDGCVMQTTSTEEAIK